MVDHLKEGLAYVTNAVQQDQAQNFKEAASLYEQALFHLKLALLSEQDPQRRTLITQKVEEYQKRSEAIRAMLPPGTITSNPLGFPSAPSTAPTATFSSLAPPASQSAPFQTQPSPFSFVTPQQQSPFSFATPAASQPAPFSSQPAPPFASTTQAFPPQSPFPPFPSQPPQFTVAPQTPAPPRIKPAGEMSRAEAWQTAVDLCEKGKTEDDARNYPAALPHYELALDYYLQAIKMEPNPEMKKNIRERMKVFLDRAEQLKPAVAQMGGSVPLNITIASAPKPNSQAQLLFNPVSGSACAACGGMIIGNTLTALERSWHPECFVSTVLCAGCMQPFSLNALIMKMKEGRPYHPACFEGTTGLSKEETRSFIGSSHPLVFKIEMPKKYFIPGEKFQFHFKIDNPTTYKIMRVVAYLTKTETRMEMVPNTFERRARTSAQKLGRTEFYQSSFPLGKGNFEGDFTFIIPSSLLPSEVTGVDASFVREYELVAKCKLVRPLKDVKVAFLIKLMSPTG